MGGGVSTNALMMKLSTAMNMLAKNAVQNPETENPRTKYATINIINALMTSRNKPKLNSVKGKVSRTSTGLTMALANPNSKAATTSDAVSLKRMPLKTKLATHSDNEVVPQCNRNESNPCGMIFVCTKVFWKGMIARSMAE